MQKPISSYYPDIIFYDKKHWYKDLKNPDWRYRSSTGVKKQFIEPFRRRYWIAWTVVKKLASTRVCDFGGKCTRDHFIIYGKEYHMDTIWEKYPKECQKVADQWDKEAEFGREKGSAVHDFLEALVQRKVIPYKKIYTPWIKNAIDFFKQDDTSNVLFTECEVVMADRPTKVAGMADRLDYIGGLNVKLRDIKTDINLNDTDAFQQLKPPFQHLAQNPINEYSIQVNIYADIIDRNTPYKVAEIDLINITEEKWELRKINRFKVLELL